MEMQSVRFLVDVDYGNGAVVPAGTTAVVIRAGEDIIGPAMYLVRLPGGAEFWARIGEDIELIARAA